MYQLVEFMSSKLRLRLLALSNRTSVKARADGARSTSRRFMMSLKQSIRAICRVFGSNSLMARVVTSGVSPTAYCLILGAARSQLSKSNTSTLPKPTISSLTSIYQWFESHLTITRLLAWKSVAGSIQPSVVLRARRFARSPSVLNLRSSMFIY